MSSCRHRSTGIFTLILLGVLILAGCGIPFPIYSDITLLSGERWSYTIKLELDAAEEMQWGANVQQSFNEMSMRQQASQPDVTFKVDRQENDRYVIYTIAAEGKGYDVLNESFRELFSSEGSIEKLSENEVALRIPLLASVPGKSELQIHAGTIKRSNATEVRGGTAIWRYADARVQGDSYAVAIVEPAPDLASIAPFFLLALIPLGIGGFVLWKKRQTQQ